MRAVTWHARGDVRVETVPDPSLQQPDDAIIRVTSTAICGSDLHLYGFLGPFLRRGDILGHETMGVVEAVGAATTRVRVGDRVVVPFVIACGQCRMCARGLTTQCETTQNRSSGTGAQLYGYTELYGSVPGGQAEFLRVLRADANLLVVGQDLPDERYLFLSDILPTAWQAVQYANVPADGVLGVMGLGPVGQLVARIGRHLGYRVIAVEPVAERRLLAERYGAETIDFTESALAELRDATDGRGPDSIVDAVGMEAQGNPVVAATQTIVGVLPETVAQPLMLKAGVDRLSALHLAIDAVARGGTVSLAGVYAGAVDPMPMITVFDKQLTLRGGQCNVHTWIDTLLPLAEAAHDPLGLEDLVTHRAPLERASDMYEQFRDKRDGCVKVVLKPQAVR